MNTIFQDCNFDIRGADSLEPDGPIRQLTADLKNVHENLSNILQLKKLKYVMDGIGCLVSTLLIEGAKLINRISVSG